MKCCVYPGSFDPFTNGHMDIASRALKIFDRVVILICNNSAKGQRLVPAEEMKKAIEDDMHAHFENAGRIVVDTLPGGLSVMDYMSDHREELHNCTNILRGIRDAADATAEIRLAEQYGYFSHRIGYEFVTLLARPQYRGVSSSLVREMMKIRTAGDYPIPPAVHITLLHAVRRNDEHVC